MLRNFSQFLPVSRLLGNPVYRPLSFRLPYPSRPLFSRPPDPLSPSTLFGQIGLKLWSDNINWNSCIYAPVTHNCLKTEWAYTFWEKYAGKPEMHDGRKVRIVDITHRVKDSNSK